MNLLVIAPFLPWPLDQGGKIRVFNLLRERARHHSVTLACLTDDQSPDVGQLADICSEIIMIPRPASHVADFVKFIFGRQPFNILRYRSDRFATVLLELKSRCFFDQIQIEFSMMWQYAVLFKEVPALLNAHNVETEIVHHLGDSCRNPLKRFLYRIETERLHREEIRAWRECTVCCAVSEKERRIIATAAGNEAKVRVVANGVDLERFAYRPKGAVDGSVLLLGGMEYAPNLDAATWFMVDISPLLKEYVPSCSIVLAGRGVGKVPLPSADIAVKVHDHVPDVRPYMYAADVLVVPLRMGAGTRIKILEAMAAGVPIVTTSKGCEGLLVNNGEHLLIADTPAEIARAVASLLHDRRLALRLSKNARSLVETEYCWDTIAAAME